MNIQKLHDAYKLILAKDDKQDAALKIFCEAFSPDTYALFHTEGHMTGFMAAVKAIDLALAEEYSYYTYEVPFMRKKKQKCTVSKDGKSWDFCKEKDFLNYLNTYYITK